MDFASLIGQVGGQTGGQVRPSGKTAGNPAGPGQSATDKAEQAAITPGATAEGKEGVFAALVKQTAAWHEASPGAIDAVPNPWKMKLPATGLPTQSGTEGSLEKDLLGALEKIEGLTGGVQEIAPSEQSLEAAVSLHADLVAATEAKDGVKAPNLPAAPGLEETATPLSAELQPTKEAAPGAETVPAPAGDEITAPPPLPQSENLEAAIQAGLETGSRAPVSPPGEAASADRTPATELPQGDREARARPVGSPPAEAQRAAGPSADSGGFSGNTSQDQGSGPQTGKQPLVPAAGASSITTAPPETSTTLPASPLGTQGALPQSDFAGALDRAAGKASAGSANQSEQLALRIQTAVSAGQDRISVQLHPAELGRIDVQLDIAEDGRLRGAILAERSEALDLLQRDIRLLERALNDAGLKTDSGSFSFDLREQSAQDKAFARDHGQRDEGAAEDEGEGREGAEAQGRRTHHDGLLDLTV